MTSPQDTTPESADRAARRIRAQLLINKMCKGDKWQMSIPPQPDDSEILLTDVIAAVIEDSRMLENEVESLRSALSLVEKDGERLREAVELLDRVEISEGGETFDGSIAGGAPCEVNLFMPGPKYYEWEAAVRANRRTRAARSSTEGNAP